MRRTLILLAILVAGLAYFPGSTRAARAQTPFYGFTGWATYYGIEDGFVRGDIMYDGTSYDPSDPTIAAASFLIPLYTWLRVCTQTQCIIVQIRDRGLLDENSILLDLSRSAYALLFGSLGGKQWVSAYFSEPGSLTVLRHPVVTTPIQVPGQPGQSP
jgi:rare lipoprotein A (peptidoglycan hydrolase)